MRLCVLRGWLVPLLLLSVLTYAIAEEITLTTYYPSPRGVYKELRTTDNTYLAVDGGNVGIGNTTPGAKLDVSGNITSSGDMTAAGTVFAHGSFIGNTRVVTHPCSGCAGWGCVSEGYHYEVLGSDGLWRQSSPTAAEVCYPDPGGGF